MFGLFGLFGFSGFLPHVVELPVITPFAIPFSFLFFTSFGLFGFYYVGKMSNMVVDEQFKQNAYRAKAIANRIALYPIKFADLIVLLIATLHPVDSILSNKFIKSIIAYMTSLQIDSTLFMLSIVLIAIGLAFALSLYLQLYLQYRFQLNTSKTDEYF